MLVKAVAAVKEDKTKALDMFNKGEGQFPDRDLYVFCVNVSDGITVAMGNPNEKQLIGQDGRARKDFHRQGVWPRTLCRGAEAGRSNHRGQLYERKACGS